MLWLDISISGLQHLLIELKISSRADVLRVRSPSAIHKLLDFSIESTFF